MKRKKRGERKKRWKSGGGMKGGCREGKKEEEEIEDKKEGRRQSLFPVGSKENCMPQIGTILVIYVFLFKEVCLIV